MKLNNKYFLLFISVALLIIISWIITYYLLVKLDYNNRGTLGDMFGGLNTIFSGLAFAGIIITIIMQHDEINDTKTELKFQNATLALQRFENTFFNLINLHTNIVESIYYYEDSIKKTSGGDPLSFFGQQMKEREMEKIIIKGREVFKQYYHDMLTKIQGDPDKYKEIYFEYFDYYESEFGHYFSNLFEIFDSINLYLPINIEDSDKYSARYASIVASMISEYEILWLFYHCLQSTNIRYKLLIEKYGLLRNIKTSLLGKHEHKSLYNESAYKRHLLINNKSLN